MLCNQDNVHFQSAQTEKNELSVDYWSLFFHIINNNSIIHDQNHLSTFYYFLLDMRIFLIQSQFAVICGWFGVNGDKWTLCCCVELWLVFVQSGSRWSLGAYAVGLYKVDVLFTWTAIWHIPEPDHLQSLASYRKIIHTKRCWNI